MAEWAKYGLKDIPFLAAPAIKITSNDIRSNGKLYYADFAKAEINSMYQMIKLDAFPWIFLQTEGEVLGNGKSAFMAHVYLKLVKEEKNVLWAFARDDPRLTNLLSEILESFITQGKLAKIKKQIGSLTVTEIELKLKEFPNCTYGSKVIQGLTKLLNVTDEELTRAFSMVKRSIPTINHGELFGALLHLSYACGESRFTIFIDQFEEYVLSHTSNAQQIKLAHEINDLLREIGETTTFVVSTHPKVTNQLISAAPEADTFKVQNAAVRLPLMEHEDLFKMVILYLKTYRIDTTYSEFYPFDPEIIHYAIERTELNPRDLIISLRNSLLYGALNEFCEINEKFVSSLHYRIFGGLPNKIKEFKLGTWKHDTIS